MRFGSPPVAGMMKMSDPPDEIFRENAMYLPSGENAGIVSPAKLGGGNVSCFRSAPSSEYRKRLTGSFQLLRVPNSNQLPSGAHLKSETKRISNSFFSSPPTAGIRYTADSGGA